MTDYTEEQSNEIEALESIYPEELTGYSRYYYREFWQIAYSYSIVIAYIISKPSTVSVEGFDYIQQIFK